MIVRRERAAVVACRRSIGYRGAAVVRLAKQPWSDDELQCRSHRFERSCLNVDGRSDSCAGVSGLKTARRHRMNTNPIFTILRDIRCAPDLAAVPSSWKGRFFRWGSSERCRRQRRPCDHAGMRSLHADQRRLLSCPRNSQQITLAGHVPVPVARPSLVRSAMAGACQGRLH